jgi:zinc protease
MQGSPDAKIDRCQCHPMHETPMIQFIKETLPNGLDVIVHEDHHAPLVAVSVWYHVGSKNERPGLTGFAHLFEHLMFEGSEHQPRGYFEPLQHAGAALNGSTSADRTNYWELVPSTASELALWMEADRMGWLLPAVTEQRFNTQREVVLNERRQNYENRPYGLAQFALFDAMYPADHPYHWPTIGDPADLRAAQLADVHEFFRRFYHPPNASLAIAGDITPAEALRLAGRWFGEIAAGPAVPRVAPPPVAAVAGRIVLEDRIDLPRLHLAWPTPALFAPGDAALDLLGDLLANGRTSRLYRRLMHDDRMAADVAASQGSREAGSLFQIAATAAPGRTLAQIEAAIADELRRFVAAGPTPDEIERGRRQAEASFIYRLQTLGGFGGRADQLNAYNVYVGTPDYFDADLQRYLDVTADDLVAAARALDPAAALALSIVPRGATEQALVGSTPAIVS